MLPPKIRCCLHVQFAEMFLGSISIHSLVEWKQEKKWRGEVEKVKGGNACALCPPCSPQVPSRFFVPFSMSRCPSVQKKYMDTPWNSPTIKLFEISSHYVFRVPAKYSAWLKTEILAEFWPENILDAFNGGQTSERIAADRFISCSILGEWSDSVYQWTGRGGTKETKGTWFERKVHHFKGKRMCMFVSLWFQ